MKKIIPSTEQGNNRDGLEFLSVKEILAFIHQEDQKITDAVETIIPLLSAAVEQSLNHIKQGGRVFYVGAGTSGRLGIVDASEIPPTFGVEGLFIGIIAGGDKAIRKAVEFSEDDENQAWIDLSAYTPTEQDIVVGITASGKTPYVLGALRTAREKGLLTIGITQNQESAIAAFSDFCLEIITGPEFIRGSTRMKAGTAQKMTLNMFSTAIMVKLGKVKGEKMVDMQISNAKLLHRGAVMIMEETGLDFESAKILLQKTGSVRKAIESITPK